MRGSDRGQGSGIGDRVCCPPRGATHLYLSHFNLEKVRRTCPVKRILVWGFFFGLVVLSACQAKDDSWQRVATAGVLRVGLDPTYPPFEFDEGDGVAGIDVDLARALADELGLEVQFVLFGYDGLYDALGTHQVDVLISGLVIVPERGRDFAYSDPYFNAGELLIIQTAMVGEIESMADLNGRSLTVELGAQGHVEATVWERRLPELTIQPLPTAAEALTAVLENKTDAALVDAISAHLFLGQQPGLTAVAEPVTVDPFAIVVRREDEQLRQTLNQTLTTIDERGQLDDILAKWFQP